MKNNFARFAAATIVVGLAAVSTPSYAYRMIQNTTVGRVSAGAAVACNASGGFAHWANGNIAWRLNTSGQGAGKEAALSAAAQSWTVGAVVGEASRWKTVSIIAAAIAKLLRLKANFRGPWRKYTRADPEPISIARK